LSMPMLSETLSEDSSSLVNGHRKGMLGEPETHRHVAPSGTLLSPPQTGHPPSVSAFSRARQSTMMHPYQTLLYCPRAPVGVPRRLRNTNKHPEKGSSCSFSWHNRANESMPFLPSTASIATRMRICGGIWIIRRHPTTPGSAPPTRLCPHP